MQRLGVLQQRLRELLQVGSWRSCPGNHVRSMMQCLQCSTSVRPAPLSTGVCQCSTLWCRSAACSEQPQSCSGRRLRPAATPALFPLAPMVGRLACLGCCSDVTVSWHQLLRIHLPLCSPHTGLSAVHAPRLRWWAVARWFDCPLQAVAPHGRQQRACVHRRPAAWPAATRAAASCAEAAGRGCWRRRPSGQAPR
jgi:hypothetical protein